MSADPQALVTEAGRLLMQLAEHLGHGLSLRVQPANHLFVEPSYTVLLDHCLDHGSAKAADTALCIAIEKQADREHRYQEAA